MAGEFAVIGLGQFGAAVARSLAATGQAVLAIDQDADRVEAIKDDVDAAVRADTTDEAALDGLRIEKVSVVIVAIGVRATEASIMTTALLAQMGVPRIIARAANDLHARILRAVGATEVIDPEQEMGRRLARRLSHTSIIDQISLGDAELAELEAPEAFVGHTLASLDLRNRYGVSVLAIRRRGGVEPNPRATELIETGDMLVVIGTPDAIEDIAALA